MEEKKFDPYQFTGFILIALILTWMLYRNGPEEVPTEEKTTTEQQVTTPPVSQAVQDSLQQQQKVVAYGDLGNLFVPNNLPNTVFTTENLTLELQAPGGGIQKLTLQEFENYEDLPIPMVQNGNMDFAITLNTKDGRILNTKDFYFTPSLTERDEEFIVSMRAALSETQYVAYEYVFPKTG